MIKYADVIVDLQAGDTGKGKVAHELVKIPNIYTHVIRYNGGGNAGHTFYHEGKKFVTHFIPVGVFYGIKSIIGPGCVLNVVKLLEEINELQVNGIQVIGNLFIDKRVHIITDNHVEEDYGDIKIGTTKTGNGPAYRDKYYRKGLRAENVPLLEPMLIDIYEELHNTNEVKILFEGAQGFELDIDWGDYPYVTSSHCTVGSAILNGVPPQTISKVFGICKGYNTYVGAKQFETEDPIFEKIRQTGKEFGSTTGRPRQVNWNNMDTIIKAANINGVTDLIVNKIDILEEIGVMKFEYKGQLLEFETIEQFKDNFKLVIFDNCPLIKYISFSTSAQTI